MPETGLLATDNRFRVDESSSRLTLSVSGASIELRQLAAAGENQCGRLAGVSPTGGSTV
jgi:hypothetical protein